MSSELTDTARRLIEGRNFAHFVTLVQEGSPQVTPVWVDHGGRHVLVNTAEGRLKWRNVERDPRVALSILDSANDYSYVQIRGRVVEVTLDGAWEHIDKLSFKYTGNRNYPRRPGETRVILKILPEHVSGWRR